MLHHRPTVVSREASWYWKDIAQSTATTGDFLLQILYIFGLCWGRLVYFLFHAASSLYCPLYTNCTICLTFSLNRDLCDVLYWLYFLFEWAQRYQTRFPSPFKVSSHLRKIVLSCHYKKYVVSTVALWKCMTQSNVEQFAWESSPLLTPVQSLLKLLIVIIFSLGSPNLGQWKDLIHRILHLCKGLQTVVCHQWVLELSIQ